MKFGRGQFDPEKIDDQRTSREPPIRTLFTLSHEEVDELRAEMKRDGAYMRECLRKFNELKFGNDS
ncbi:hypothetical protein ALQ29_01192 [Pseudomonas marginalis pv. marginalis]|uniref:Uncharacterized protein n=2 Tax=Pseudomonas marginalis TaxID=298 RepID=A0A3M3WEN2_PSEMA|nr:hypothetical protein ALQ38_03200 [Pseudomonas marginalis pv. marginalis]RMP10073.1 hypothetical protein ALQ29_01192 [Pseudomonas marginalis pv. marginalis]